MKKKIIKVLFWQTKPVSKEQRYSVERIINKIKKEYGISVVVEILVQQVCYETRKPYVNKEDVCRLFFDKINAKSDEVICIFGELPAPILEQLNKNNGVDSKAKIYIYNKWNSEWLLTNNY